MTWWGNSLAHIHFLLLAEIGVNIQSILIEIIVVICEPEKCGELISGNLDMVFGIDLGMLILDFEVKKQLGKCLDSFIKKKNLRSKLIKYSFSKNN